MIKRLLIACVGLSCLTTFIAIQQTSQYRIQYDKVIWGSYPRFYNAKPGRNNENADIQQYSLITTANKREIYLQKRDDSLINQYYNDLLKSKKVPVRSGPSQLDTNFLMLPILFYNMGPNNLFRVFKETIPLAVAMNRTLVIPPFHHHPRMKRTEEVKSIDLSQEATVKVDIFDQTYKSIVETDAGKTVDMQILRRLLPATTINMFYSVCNKKLNTVITCGVLSGKRRDGLEQFKTFMNISVARIYAVDNFRDVIENTDLKVNLLGAVRNTKNDRCVGLALGSRCFGSRSTWFKHWVQYSSYVLRPPKIRILAKQFVSSIFHNQPFLAIHWRYENEDWQDMCKSSRPQAVRKINEPMCRFASQLVNNVTVLHSVAKRLRDFAEKRYLKYIYFAAPPQLLTTLKKLKGIVPDLYIISDVLQFSSRNSDLLTEVFSNNFAASFLEQELCYLSSLFLGSPLSSWTQTVMLDREAVGIKEHSSVIDVLVEDSSGFPKLTWYFPEGI